MLSNTFYHVLESLLKRSMRQYDCAFVDKLIDILVAMDHQGLSIREQIDELAEQIQEKQELNVPFVKLAAYLSKISLVNVPSYLALSKQFQKKHKK